MPSASRPASSAVRSRPDPPPRPLTGGSPDDRFDRCGETRFLAPLARHLLAVLAASLRNAATSRLRATAGSDASVLGDEIWRHGYVLPVLIGVFMGAPLVARDFETESYRFP